MRLRKQRRKFRIRQRRRALVVITDGVDSASTMKPSEVSAIASSLDVPVYILVIAIRARRGRRAEAPMRGPMADLAAWTGGDSLAVDDTPTVLVGHEPAAGRAPSPIHRRVRAGQHAGMARARAAGPQAGTLRPRPQRLHGGVDSILLLDTIPTVNRLKADAIGLAHLEVAQVASHAGAPRELKDDAPTDVVADVVVREVGKYPAGRCSRCAAG